jgi:ABC-2 type transport system permease protein
VLAAKAEAFGGTPDWSGYLKFLVIGDAVGGLLVFGIVASGLSIVLVAPLALAASVGRGYLPAVGLMMLVLILAQVLAQLGLGPWFPWSVPGLATGIGGPGTDQVGLASCLLVAVTGIAGAGLTAAWWRLADQR